MNNSNVGFYKLVFELPPLTSVEAVVLDAGFDDNMIKKLQAGGLSKIPVGDGTPLFVLINKAAHKLNLLVENLSDRVGLIIFAHSIPIVSPEKVSFLQLCFDGLYLDNVPKIAVSGQPCAIMHMAVQIASCYLSNLPEEKGVLLIGADQAYSAKERIFFGSAMGDSAVAGLIMRNPTHNYIITSTSECEIIACDGEDSDPEDIARFRQLNPLFIRQAIEKSILNTGVSLSDIKYIVPHTPYTVIWDTVSELLRYPRERILTNYISETGHLNSNDSFIHYARAVDEGLIQSGDVVLLVNPAFGGTRGCTIIRR